MENVNVTKTINVNANAAWEKLSAFSGIENFSPIEKSVTEGQGVGMKRTCFLPDNVAIHEELTKLDTTDKHFTYIITEGPFPVEGYKSDVIVKPTGENSCEVSWSCEYKLLAPEAKQEMENLFGGFYHTIIDSLAELIQSEAVV